MQKTLEVAVAAVGVVVGMLVSFRVWYRATAGWCKSSRSMRGKTVIITGGSAGIGKETARDLLKRGARVILACRNLEKAFRVADELRAGVQGGGEVVVQRLDTSVLSSVRDFAKVVLDSEKEIHVLINNAGIVGSERRWESADGFQLTMATNYFGHFLLTNLLLGRLIDSAPSRVINVSSICHGLSEDLDFEDLNFRNKPYTMMKAYNQSKLCNVLFSRELADKVAGTGVTSNSLHPGVVKTESLDNMPYTILDLFLRQPILFVAKSAASGAQTTIHLAVAEELAGVTGKYFSDCREKEPSELARCKDLAEKLWEASATAVKLQQDEIHY